jgi:hypothetical protein
VKHIVVIDRYVRYTHSYEIDATDEVEAAGLAHHKLNNTSHKWRSALASTLNVQTNVFKQG